MKPMDVVKKNLVSILCGVAALAAVVFYFVGARPKFDELQGEMAQRVGKPQEFQQILGGERKLPTVKEGEVVKLQTVPNPSAIKVADAIVAQLQKQARDVMTQVVAINQAGRELLVPEALPKPQNQTYAYRFRDAYQQVLKRGGKPDGLTKTPNLPDGVLRSAEPPTDQEIATAKNKLWEDEYRPQVIIQDGQPRNLREVAADFLKATETFDQEFRRKRAAEYKVYLEPAALLMSPRLEKSTEQVPTPAELWYAQMALWVQQDVCTAIARINSSNPAFRDIPTSPVKHLLQLDVQPNQTMYVVKGGTAAAAGVPVGADPSAAPAPPTDPTTKDFNLSPTGRVSNSLYDVVQYRLSLVVEADSLRSLIAYLQQGHFMSVLEVDVKGIDLDQALDEGYGYGNRPVVEVKLRCESLFLRDWTAWVPQPPRPDGVPVPPIQGPMPLDVQKLLGVPTPNLTAPPPAAPANPVALQ